MQCCVFVAKILNIDWVMSKQVRVNLWFVLPKKDRESLLTLRVAVLKKQWMHIKFLQRKSELQNQVRLLRGTRCPKHNLHIDAQ